MEFFRKSVPTSLSSPVFLPSPQRPLPVLVLGQPAKTGQADVRDLSAALQFPSISPADLMEREGLGLGLPQHIQALVRKGTFVPEILMQAFLMRRLQAPDCARGFILDGYPQTLDQAEHLEENLLRINAHTPVVILLSSPETLPSSMEYLPAFYSASRIFQIAGSDSPGQIAENIALLLSRQSRCFVAASCLV